MTQEHPITPPPELVEQWIKDCDNPEKPRWQEYEQDIATMAAQWGADRELEACCEWLERNYNYPATNYRADHPLRVARRPKPPSSKEQALEALDRMHRLPTLEDSFIIRAALEQLND